MEVAIIDWKNIYSRFVRDDLYEYINAPKWVDFSDPIDHVDDEDWFCRPSCDHPKTAEDFLKEEERTTNSSSRLKKSASVSDIPPFGERNKRDPTLKKRTIKQPVALSSKGQKYHRDIEDIENRDPNVATPLKQGAKLGKEVTPLCTRKKPIEAAVIRKENPPKLRSTQSARNLFSGGDFLNKVAEFCNELKKLATRARYKESADHIDVKEAKEDLDENIEVLNDKEKERTPLLELSTKKSEVLEKSCSKQQLRRKRRTDDDAENTPISIDFENIQKNTEAVNSLHIRISPPTPQCFSAIHKKAIDPKPFRSRPQNGVTRFRMVLHNPERGILQELKQEEKIVEGGRDVAEKEARSLDVFWFLKPCTLSS